MSIKGFFESSLVQSEAPPPTHPLCGSCGLFKTCQTPKMRPYGKGKSKVLIVGEAPGQTEDEEGRPFIGKAGQFLREHLEDLGVVMDEDCLTTNAIICRPPDNRLRKDKKEIDYCRPNILKTLSSFQPYVIILLGKTALQSVLTQFWKGKLGEMDTWVGWRIPVNEHWICPTYHPSFLLRRDDEMLNKMFHAHLEAAFNLVDEGPPPPTPDYQNQVELIHNDTEAAKAIREIDKRGGWVAFDYETNCLKPEYEKARIYSAAISNGKRTIAYPWIGDVIPATSEFLKSKNTRKIAANLKMEERWTIKHLGHRVRNWGWDNVVSAHCIDNRPNITSLKFQSFVNLGIETYNSNVEPYLHSHGKSHYNRIKEIDLKTLLTYNGMDAVLEYHLAMKQRKDLGYED